MSEKFPSEQNIENENVLEQKEQNRFTIEPFTFNPQKLEELEDIAKQLYSIDQKRFSGDQFFNLELFKSVLINTIPNETNNGKINTVILIKNPKSNSIFGFIYAEPAENIYTDSEDELLNFFPERLSNPDIESTAYITDLAFERSGIAGGGVKRITEALISELRKNNYKFIELDATTNFGLADSLKRDFSANIIESNPHDSEYGPQVFFRFKL
ncbi:MAG: hypothetical protein WCQ32_02675 [bacterium]